MQCVKCDGSGKCQPCRGSGRSRSSGFMPQPLRPQKCSWCKGTGKCDSYAGSGKIAFRAGNSIEPHIFVLGSERVPSPIFAVALTGARWRYLEIPAFVLMRSPEAQLGYVAWRCRTHYRERKGICLCFGKIVGFKWVKGMARPFFSTSTGASLTRMPACHRRESQRSRLGISRSALISRGS
jgi:hypothetical protein